MWVVWQGGGVEAVQEFGQRRGVWLARMSGFKVGLGLRRRTSHREGLAMDSVVLEGAAHDTPRKQSFKSNIQVPNVKLKKFRKYDTFIWLREPHKEGSATNPDKPLNRLRSLNSM